MALHKALTCGARCLGSDRSEPLGGGVNGTLMARWAAGQPGARVARVGIAAHIARLRAVVGHELLLLPSVSVLPVDEAGRVLLVRHAGHDDGWGALGGAVEPGESPAAAAVQGGPRGDQRRHPGRPPAGCARRAGLRGQHTRTVTASPTSPPSTRPGSSPAPRHPVTASSARSAWFAPDELAALPLSGFARALLHAIGYL